jgi:parallel beta-helix repeat protein
MLIENNLFYNNGHYGIDPHTGTHDMTIRNNTVSGNNGTAIICSLDCYNILIENNKVYDNAGSGIAFSKNMTNSVARNNYVYNAERCIFVSQSHNNEVYNNTVNNCGNGIYLKSESSHNSIFNNMIQNVNGSALKLNDGVDDNLVYSNTIVMPSSAEEEAIDNEDQDSNTFEDNTILINGTVNLDS